MNVCLNKKSLPLPSYGYPDTTYLSRVQEELAAKGVDLSSMTSEERSQVDQFLRPLERRLGREI